MRRFRVIAIIDRDVVMTKRVVSLSALVQGGSQLISFWTHGMSFDLLTLVRIGLTVFLESRIISEMGR